MEKNEEKNKDPQEGFALRVRFDPVETFMRWMTQQSSLPYGIVSFTERGDITDARPGEESPLSPQAAHTGCR